MNKKSVLISVAIIGLVIMSLIGMKLKQNNFIDPYEIKSTNTYEEKQYKLLFNTPTRQNSKNYSLDNFKGLKRGQLYKDFGLKIGTQDFSMPPDALYPNGYREEFTINSNKVAFVFITFMEGNVGGTLLTLEYPLYDIVIITQRKEKIIVPVNPDYTFNWEAIKDKID